MMLRRTLDRAGIVLFLSATPWQRPTSLKSSFFGTVTSMPGLESLQASLEPRRLQQKLDEIYPTIVGVFLLIKE